MVSFGTSNTTSLNQQGPEAVCPPTPNVSVKKTNVVYNIVVPGGEADKVFNILGNQNQSDYGPIYKRTLRSPTKVCRLLLFFLALLSIVLGILDLTSPRVPGRTAADLESRNVQFWVWLLLLFCLVLLSIVVGLLDVISPRMRFRRAAVLEAWNEHFRMLFLFFYWAMFMAAGHKGDMQ
ncbi:uncharacterized protein LOC144099166 isoform X2 [Amblyomma americanum]